jgi:hypothetical protein
MAMSDRDDAILMGIAFVLLTIVTITGLYFVHTHAMQGQELEAKSRNACIAAGGVWITDTNDPTCAWSKQ